MEYGKDYTIVRTEIMCPNCFSKKLLKETDTKDERVYCDECGTDFIQTGENSVRFK
jgi:DNA-directed RNA polymerase subunit RPC12/RpoP